MEMPYRITIKDWPEINHVVWAKKRSQAIYKSWSQAREAGYRIEWTKFRAIRISILEAL
jgi:hypothetical protein